ncbi:hypothetical protein [Parerythrobacter jejuensis]|uniref:Uncharacterized protein n=1 Tax=Parerythrobacter jejuensis TaxID=795812 RepID=A0A845B1K6_9SPHN|nr:hypothetical protein [Parerythrobacter jejuensis]MXP32868.1 hypothetical protein [Parerythrobacter jejuensis]
MNIRAKQAHRTLAGFIGLFLAVHFATHLAALLGIAAQDSALQAGRLAYQFPLIEIALVAALMAQIGLGLRLLGQIRKRPRKGFWHAVQFASACYLGLFIVLHTTAAVMTRLVIGLDTNFYWAAGTLVLAPLKYGFAPYYLIAVTALVSHIIAALHFRGSRPWHKPALLIGPLLGSLIVMAYAGAFYAVDLPTAYRDYFGAFPGVG